MNERSEPDNIKYWVAFSRISRIGAARTGRLLAYFGTMAEAWLAGPSELRNAGLDQGTVRVIVEARAKISPDDEMERLHKAGIHAYCWTDDAYPKHLLEIDDRPPVLFVRGELRREDEWAVAIVGTRRATPYGRQVSEHFATDLAHQGITVVSGLARGVDAAAHAGAVEAGCTAAVLGTGIDVIYPAQHAALAGRIAQRGALVTEFLPGTPPLAHHFPLRNRILSGLVRAVVVVEASEKSGSLITARMAAEQGRDVMVVPGDVRGGANKGGHALLRDGARLVETAADVLDELGWTLPAATPAGDDAVPPLVRILRQGGGLPVDDLVAHTGRPAADLLAELLDLELGGLVTRDLSGRFLPSRGKW